MENFQSRIKEPWTTYDNRLIQEETVFKSSNQKLCYLFLVSYAKATKIFPSMNKIAKAICATTRTAMTVIQDLEDMGFIEVKKTPGLTNNYFLNDYFEVVATSEKFSLGTKTSEKISPVKNLHGTSEKISPVPVKNFHPKTKTKLKTKNKNSSSSQDAQNLIDNELKEKYPNVPFDEVKIKLLSDQTVDISTDKQYKGLLEHRLKAWKPRKTFVVGARTKKKAIRTETIPEHMDEPNYPHYESLELSKEEMAAKKKAMMEKLKKFRE